jgi:formate dehydrogenase maturation protein FdhE
MATLAQDIRRLGFRKWYERQLIDAHLSLITCVLCMVLAAALLEGLEFDEGLAKAATTLGTVFAAGIVAWFAWARYRDVVSRAEYYGGQSVCATCKTYARFEVVDAADDGDTWLRVRCRKCASEWLLH